MLIMVARIGADPDASGREFKDAAAPEAAVFSESAR
jgi:hypothetical protein